jgi:5-methylcytosine-specific restriction endonuclease McrA
VCSVRKAIILVFRGKAQIVEALDISLKTVSKSFPVPSVVRLILYVRVPVKRVVLSKRNILKRDNYRCQYCGTTHGSMTVDHVIPKRLRGTDSWENLVCSCARCNNIKGDRSPDEAEMTLLRRPKKPNNLTFIRQLVGVVDQQWKPYLFME